MSRSEKDHRSNVTLKQVLKAPVTKVGQNLSLVVKNINSTEPFVNLNVDFL